MPDGEGEMTDLFWVAIQIRDTLNNEGEPTLAEIASMLPGWDNKCKGLQGFYMYRPHNLLFASDCPVHPLQKPVFLLQVEQLRAIYSLSFVPH